MEKAGKTNYPIDTKVKLNRVVAVDLGFEASFDVKHKGLVTGTITHVFPGIGTNPDEAVCGFIMDRKFKNLVVGNKINLFDGDFVVINS